VPKDPQALVKGPTKYFLSELRIDLLQRMGGAVPAPGWEHDDATKWLGVH